MRKRTVLAHPMSIETKEEHYNSKTTDQPC